MPTINELNRDDYTTEQNILIDNFIKDKQAIQDKYHKEYHIPADICMDFFNEILAYADEIVDKYEDNSIVFTYFYRDIIYFLNKHFLLQEKSNTYKCFNCNSFYIETEENIEKLKQKNIKDVAFLCSECECLGKEFISEK